MTVCIGVISQPMVIVATDRMITSADIQFEQQQPKIFRIGLNTLALISGDIAVQTELVETTRNQILAGRVIGVENMARVYAQAYGAYCKRKAEAEVLQPIGVGSVDDLMRRKWPVSHVQDLLYQVRQAAQGYDVATIIAGSDGAGPHLFVIDQPGKYSMHDRIGFASVGIGQRHAESQFMFAGYTPDWKFPDALYLTYVAKKRAEVAPGVGRFTDMAVITSPAAGAPPDSNNVVSLNPHFIPMLDRVYDAETARIGIMRDQSNIELDAELKKFFESENAKFAQAKGAQEAANSPVVEPTPPTPTDDPKDPPPSPE